MSNVKSWFVTGTDTDIGKTLVSSALLYALSLCGLRTAGMKPVAAGAALRDGALHNDDADRLASAGNVDIPAELATPYLLREAAAPHIAAALEDITIDPAHVVACYRRVAALADAVVVEGVGGFCVPLSAQFDTAEMARQLDLPVILVVGLRMGCLSHALLTAEAIAARGLTLAGWVANVADPDMRFAQDNVEALAARLPAPFLGAVPWLEAPSAAAAADRLDFTRLAGWPSAGPGAGVAAVGAVLS